MDLDKKTFEEYFLDENGIGTESRWSEDFNDTFHTRDPVMVASFSKVLFLKRKKIKLWGPTFH